MTQSNAPVWRPLEAAIGSRIAGWFMWMFEVELADGSAVHAYKHCVTRRYMHLAADGRAFQYCGGEGYSQVDLATAIEDTFHGWDIADPPAEDVEALHAAIRSARSRA